jgi:hypothetical protein
MMSSANPPRTFPAIDELKHEIGQHPLWQESVFLTWSDTKSGLFGFHRIGQECNSNGGTGMVTAWNGVTSREGTRFRRYLFQPLRPQDRPDNGFAAGDLSRVTFDGTTTRWTMNDPECALNLVSRDFTPRFDLYKDGGTVVNDFAQGHIEVGGTIQGSVQLGGRSIDINGLAYRDHSWGKRDRSTMLSHRWIAGTVGPALTFNATAWHGVDGSLRTYGIVCRDGEIVYAKEVDIVIFMEIDALSHRGGILRMVLEDGDVIEIKPKLIDAFMTQHHNTGCVDGMCEVTWKGFSGFCDLEVSTNPRAGTGPIVSLVRATMTDGITKRDWTL